MPEIDKDYGALLVDTSIFDGNGLRLEKGLLGTLSQFKESPVDYLFPDVIKKEVEKHLEAKIKRARAALEKALTDAEDHLFFEGSELNDAKDMLISGKELEGLAQSRVEKFINTTGTVVLKTGDYVSVSELLSKYFSATPPFAETGKKKCEFPDAIVLLAVEAWANEKDMSVLAVAKDNDWKKYCENSIRIDYKEEFSDGLSLFNRVNAPYKLIKNLEDGLINGTAGMFLAKVEAALEAFFDGFTPDQEADSHLYWESEGCYGWFDSFKFIDNELQIIDKDEDWVVLEVFVNIKVGAEGEFSFSMYDSIDKDHIYMGSIDVTTEKEFGSEILITVSGNLEGSIDELKVDKVEVVSPITSIDFGIIEPDYGDDYYCT